VQELFGIPMDSLATGLVVVLVACLAAIAVLAARNRILLTLAMRNMRRRRGRTVLIVVGLMLGTAIISAALSTGDTLSQTIRSTVVSSLGNADEIVSVEGAEAQGFQEASPFDEALFAEVSAAAEAHPRVDGVAPAIIVNVPAQDLTSRQSEPQVTLFASDPAHLDGFDEITSGGEVLSLGDLAPDEVYLTRDAADELDSAPGNRLVLYAGGRPVPVRVAAVVEFDGHGGEGPAVLTSLDSAQRLLGLPGQIEHILISNEGDALSGVRYSDEVVAALEPTLAPLGLEIEPAKQEAIELADEVGAVFMSLFTTFGSFSIIAGMLLTFLVFVMLAAERRTEMGISRALGVRRGHLVQTFLFEGAAYDLVAAAIGAFLGLVVAYVMVAAIAAAFGEQSGLDIEHYVSAPSVVVAYSLGVLLTFAVVTFSAWRVSRLNIVSAIRSLPERVGGPPRRARWLLGAIALGGGALIAAGGLSSEQASVFYLGASLMIIGLVPVLRLLGMSERAAFTVAGLGLVVLWLLPSEVLESVLPDLRMDFTIFLLSGVMIVIGATWTVVYNADVLLKGVNALFGRFRGLAPLLRLSIAYPLRSRFRTGVTMALFTLVVFTLVVGTTTTTAFNSAFDDEETFSGGFDVRAVTAPINPIVDIDAAVRQTPGAPKDDIEIAAGQASLFAEARQSGRDAEFASHPVFGFDDRFLASTTYEFAAIAEGYGSSEEVWEALRAEPGLAVVDPYVVPRRDTFGFGVLPDFQIEGFFLEDETFAPVPVEIRDPETGAIVPVSVIGVLRDTAPEFMIGLSTSQATLAPFGERALPDTYWLRVVEGVDPRETAQELESAFLGNGMEAEALAETLADAVSSSQTFTWMLQGFMGLGLIVGVAGLGVITARAVVERRQQIGVLRSIGYRSRMVQRVFMLESTFIAGTSIVIGTVLGLILALNIVRDSRSQPSWESMSFTVPWIELGVIFAVVYLAAIATTLIPARKASRVYPAEALRYE
jgi:putative ABC transport system permease protein